MLFDLGLFRLSFSWGVSIAPAILERVGEQSSKYLTFYGICIGNTAFGFCRMVKKSLT